MKAVDLRSDTVTRPTPAMREAIARAEVGDDVFGDDPTVNELERVAARRLGKEAALFVPSGTMANQVAMRMHCRPGDAALMEAGAHPVHHEAGAPAQLSGITVQTVRGERGILDPDRLVAAFPPEDVHYPPVRLVMVEDTANEGGGTVYPLEVLDAVAALARQRGAATHLDGARLFNAEVASGIPVARRARGYDTVSICLSKGLGAPVGSLLCGPAPLIHRARWVRKAFGGGMRQAGFLAAAGLHALAHHVPRLADDHRRARRLADGLREIGFEPEEPETNMVYLGILEAPSFEARLKARGVLCCALSPARLRLVTHLDLDDDAIERALGVFRELYSRAEAHPSTSR
jgi:threonine aldolase